ncbi:hypothetical protein HPB48_010572 [Haemaphysalis longicornis]|uniref:Uncharacterized protein n=1 Tax=Haemaphysalis longicornis TaxID=44386 RepID=A0A9J6H410_HAELO|nr:hypothetical protein HPB48_010572 [Haemaphysalis longicornis]
MPPKGKPKPPPKAAAPAAKGPAAKTKGSPAKAPQGKPGAATPGPPTPPRPLPMPPMPPMPPDEKKILFQSLMEKKLMEWDKMMDKSRKIDERNRSLEAFRQLSDEEVDLATTEVYRKQFKELINTKFDCFDQLARETDARRRGDEIKKFQQVCDDELSLAKALGPRNLLLRQEQERQDKLAKQQEKAAEEKRKTAEKQTQAGGKPQMMPESMRGRMMRLFPEMCPEEQEATAKRAFTMEQRLKELTGPAAVGSPAPRRKASNLTYDQLLAVAVSLLPKPPSQTEVKVEVKEASPEKAPEMKTLEDSVMEKKLKLLTQLDAARGVLQNYAPGLNRSMDEEVQTRLRKINRLQMKVVDEILGSQADLLSDVVSDLKLEKFEEAKLRWKASSKDGTKKDGTPRSADRQTKDNFEVVKKIVMRLPELSETSTRVVTASVSSIQVPANDVCSGKSNLCPVQDDSRPVVLWERPMSDTDSFDQRRSSVHKCCDCQDGAPQASPPYFHCEHRVDIYSDVAPHYHNESLPPPLPPPRDVYYPAPTFSAQTYPLYDTNRHTPQPNLPPHLDIVSCNIAYDLEYEDSADVGVGTDTNFPVDLYNDAGEKKQDVFSETTVIIQITGKICRRPRPAATTAASATTNAAISSSARAKRRQ